MASTYHSLYYHLFFHTKGNRPLIHKSWQDRLHAYMAGCVRKDRGILIAIGGVTDHVHLLVRLAPSHSIADHMRKVKSASSRWVHEELKILDFSWQDGYTALSVNTSRVNIVKQYILTQEEHHRVKSARDELVEFLEANRIIYDKRYLPVQPPHQGGRFK
ncbi:MAG: IS200/IS605 family transposase [Candidatus Kapaibacterium sp.]